MRINTKNLKKQTILVPSSAIAIYYTFNCYNFIKQTLFRKTLKAVLLKISD
nr:hypothetical protein [uncultured bacterium]